MSSTHVYEKCLVLVIRIPPSFPCAVPKRSWGRHGEPLKKSLSLHDLQRETSRFKANTLEPSFRSVDVRDPCSRAVVSKGSPVDPSVPFGWIVLMLLSISVKPCWHVAMGFRDSMSELRRAIMR